MRVEVAKVDTRLTALENKVDMLQVAIPLYIDNSKRELLDGLRDLRSLYPAGKPHSSTPKPPTEPVNPQRPCDPLSSSSSPTDQNEDRGRHKKRKLGVENGTSRILVSPAFHGDATTISSHSLRPVAATERSPLDIRLAANGTTPHRFISGPSPASPDGSVRLDRLKRTAFQTPHRQPLVDILRPNVTPRISDSALPPAAKSGVSDQVTGHASTSGPAGARTAIAPLRSQKPGVGAARTAPKPLPPVQGTPKNADSLASTTSTLSQRSVAQTEHTRPPSVPDPSGMRGSKAHTSPAMLRREFQGQNNSSAIKLADARHTTPYDDIPSTPIRRNLQPPLSVLNSTSYPPKAGPSADPPGTTLGKPISIKDVKALTATPAFRKEQKRFIPLDDDDDDDLME
ncbi:hypothetical protein EVJ58_g3966 [Rhodofomes roseus]|uniref:Uncharacterized protein n=1 Tax=Rhodofomes roseus TaxID=34475 RepID=A0A4Y9YLC6_9APHY|nr:hypothetical protein EVJ58_g3966 [Rhodofomes roseus]